MPRRRLVIRVDASTRIGGGHVMRCLALAEELRRQRMEISFVSREIAGNLNAYIERHGFAVHRLPSPNSAHTVATTPRQDSGDNGLDWASDADQAEEVLADIRADWLIVDHYELDCRWETRMRRHVRNVMVIDDLVNRRHDCDLLLDQNLDGDVATAYKELVPDSCEILVGAKFALLRPEFREARRKSRKRDGVVRRMLVFFGATDPGNETSKALMAVRALARRDVLIDVVVGSGNPHRATIAEMCKTLPGASCLIQIDNMATFMAEADLALGAGGVASLERCCVGLPSLISILTDNQRRNSLRLAAVGAAQCLGESGRLAVEDYRAAIDALTADTLRAMSQAAFGLVDGEGCLRVAGRLLDRPAKSGPLNIGFRNACEHDASLIFGWRNAPEIRRYALDPRQIPWAEHLAWLQSALRDPDRHLLVIEENGEPAGVVRFDLRDGGVAEISIYLAPERHGRGFGTAVLRSLADWSRSHLGGVSRIRARILPDNVASLKAFEKAGFAERYRVFEIEIQN